MQIDIIKDSEEKFHVEITVKNSSGGNDITKYPRASKATNAMKLCRDDVLAEIESILRTGRPVMISTPSEAGQ